MPPRKTQDDSEQFESYGEALISLKSDFRSMREDIHDLKLMFKDSGIQIRALEDFKLKLETKQIVAAKEQNERNRRFAFNLSFAMALIEIAKYGFEWYLGHK